MSMSSIPSSSQSGKLYGWVERIGNKVPHPFLLFIYLIIVLMVTTAILSAFGVSAKNPTDGTPVVVKNLLSVEGLHWFLPNVIKNFSGFAPLGAILALVLGAGLAERVGLLPALMVKNGIACKCPLRQLYGAVYCFFQPHFFRCGVSDHATDGCADFSGGGQASSCRFTGCHCRRRLRLYG